MFAKIIIFGAFVAAASAGIAAPLGQIVHSPYAYSSYSAPAPLAYSAPIAHAPLSYSAPIAHAPLSYSAPIAHAPLSYSAPIAHAPLAYSAPIAKVAAPIVAKTVVADAYDPHPQYSYGYGVQDGLTGDNKQQQETRDGDVVQGSYSLIDADGFRRTVDYTADPIHGFNAVVRREPLGAQVVAKVAAPVAYAAPIAKVAYAAPVAKVAAPLGYTTYHH